jgi:hypothetical protein
LRDLVAEKKDCSRSHAYRLINDGAVNDLHFNKGTETYAKV